MARKIRLEFPGAIYHVINRGNYRADVFAEDGAKAAFETCLFEACVKSKWVLHAFVVMRNHFHLAVQTPTGNLVAGMHWLECTFANRFNRYRAENGHLFQGRYKALAVEEGEALGSVCHYIHLNPVRAAVVPVEQLAEYRASSYWYLSQRERPDFLRVETALTEAGSFPDTTAGRKEYAQYLGWQAAEGPAGKNTASIPMSRGWALGSKEFKRILLCDHEVAETTRAWDSSGVREVRAARWLELLDRAVARIPQGERTAHPQKSAAWKVAVASWMREHSTASHAWLAETLTMGSAAYVRNHTWLSRQGKNPAAERWLNRLGP